MPFVPVCPDMLAFVAVVLYRARSFAKKLNDAPLAIVDKRRSAHNVSEVGPWCVRGRIICVTCLPTVSFNSTILSLKGL